MCPVCVEWDLICVFIIYIYIYISDSTTTITSFTKKEKENILEKPKKKNYTRSFMRCTMINSKTYQPQSEEYHLRCHGNGLAKMQLSSGEWHIKKNAFLRTRLMPCNTAVTPTTL